MDAREGHWPSFVSDPNTYEALVADMQHYDRIRRGLPPITREFHEDRVQMRNDICAYLAASCMLQHIIDMRENQQIESLKMMTRSRDAAWTFGTFSSGGCLDAIACMKTGMLPLWGTEVCERKRRAWADLTSTADLGDTYKVDWTNVPAPDVLWSGQTCVDYSLSGPRTGAEGETGWMFVEQTKPIMQLQPSAVIIEMVANALHINGGAEVRQVEETLSEAYHVHTKVVRVWDYGDESNRERLIMVCLHQRLGEVAEHYKFPRPLDDSRRTARDIADPDDKVPSHLWRRVYNVKPFQRSDQPEPGKLYKIAQMGTGMGHSSKPNSVYSWDGTMNTQTTHNGGGVRPPLSWKPGMPINRVRKTTVSEARKAANLMESYEQWIKTFDPDDRFAYESINMGVPIGTATAINKSVQEVLQAAQVPKTYPEEYAPMVKVSQQQRGTNGNQIKEAYEAATWGLSPIQRGKHAMAVQTDAGIRQLHTKDCVVRSMLFDPGADTTLVTTDHEPYVKGQRQADCSIVGVDASTSMSGGVEGNMPSVIMNAPGYEGIDEFTDLDVPLVTVQGIRRSLFSMEGYYRDKGYEVYLRQPHRTSEMTNIPSGGSTRVPIRYDRQRGSFWIDYIPHEEIRNHVQPEHEARWLQDQMILLRHKHGMKQAINVKAETRAAQAAFSAEVAKHVHERCAHNAAVKEVIISKVKYDKDGKETIQLTKEKSDPPLYAQHPDESEVRGVKSGLRDKKRKMTYEEFHEDHGHIGTHLGCKICRLVKGAMRRIYKVYDPYRPRVPGYTWDMDMCIVSDRDMDAGYKYLIVLKCRSTDYLVVLPLKLKSDAWAAVAEWIRTTRNDPVMNRYSYLPVQHIITDLDGAWSPENEEWQKQITKKLGVRMEYISPDRHEQAGRAERAVALIEQTTKAILMQNNLAPDWWWRAAAQAAYLQNRFPKQSGSHMVPLDGDRARPLELYTDGYYSRKQIDRELSYFVPVGTPCLVHEPEVKGSSIAPKVRWGIAAGMDREVCKFMCPYTGAIRRSKSYVAYKLKDGLSYTQFLGLKPKLTARRSVQLPGDGEDIPSLQLTSSWKELLGKASQLTALTDNTPKHKIPSIYYDAGSKALPEAPPVSSVVLPEQDSMGEDEEAAAEAIASALGDKEGNLLPMEDESPGGLCNVTAATSGDEEATTAGVGHGPPNIQKSAHGPSTTPSSLEEGAEAAQPRTREGKSVPVDERTLITHDESLAPELAHECKAPAGQPCDKQEGIAPMGDEVGSAPLSDEVVVVDCEGQRLTWDENVGRFMYSKECKQIPAPDDADVAAFEKDMMPTVDITYDETMFEKAEADEARRDTVVSKEGDRWSDVLARFDPPMNPDLVDLYREWLVEHSPDSSEWTYEMFPTRRGTHVEAGLKFIPPFGRNWRVMLEDRHAKQKGTTNRELKQLLRASVAQVLRWIRSIKTIPAYHVKRRREKTMATGMRACPKTLKQALAGPDKDGWKAAADLEMKTLTEMGVFDHGYTIEEVRKLGIKKDPINISVALDNKYVDGTFERHKVRMAVAGHKYNLQKGVDYDEVFAAAPNQNTSRMLQALTVQMGLHRKSWDIKLAYCWADLPPEQMIALKYPPEYARTRVIGDGREVPEYIVLRKNCYGLPAAGKHWAEHRDAYMMKRFNTAVGGVSREGDYTCTQAVYDPTLFYITIGPRIRTDKECTDDLRPYKQEAWVSIHTDDCDAYSTSKELLEEIYKAHNTKWKAKVTSSDFMLGVKRVRHTEYDKDGNISTDEIEMTMIPYVEGMYNAFAEYIKPNHIPQTPFPQNMHLSKMGSETIDPAEHARVQDRGYMRAVGMILWAVRSCYPECQQGVSQLGSLMACPTEKAWTAAMHMIAYMYHKRHKGIRFSKTEVKEPVVFSDASNKPDQYDGLCRYGYFVQMAGGPVAFGSKKLAHVGLSAFHNEYMALRHAASTTVWIRNLLKEVGCSHMVAAPTKVYGDNLAANKLCRDHFVTTGNQYVYLPYFWTRELVKRGEIVVPHVSTKDNIADLHTKSVSKEVVHMLRAKACGYEPRWLEELVKGHPSTCSPMTAPPKYRWLPNEVA